MGFAEHSVCVPQAISSGSVANYEKQIFIGIWRLSPDAKSSNDRLTQKAAAQAPSQRSKRNDPILARRYFTG
jgi:hypothetical protein